MNNELKKRVAQVMALFNTEYNFGVNDERIDLWCSRLANIDPEAVYTAAMMIVDADTPYAPNIGKLKTLALRLQSGVLQDVSAIEAWRTVKDRMANNNVKLSELTSEALKNVIKFADLKNLDAKTLMFVRKDFIRSFEMEQQKEIDERNASIEVKRYLATKQPAVEAKQLPMSTEPDPEPPQDEVWGNGGREVFLKGLTGSLRAKMSGGGL
jgi:hypothetical protein